MRACSTVRAMRMSIDARLEVKVAEILRNQLKQSGQTKGAAVVMDPARRSARGGEFRCRWKARSGRSQSIPGPRAYGLYPPGSTFKVVTAMAALRKSADLAQ